MVDRWTAPFSEEMYAQIEKEFSAFVKRFVKRVSKRGKRGVSLFL